MKSTTKAAPVMAKSGLIPKWLKRLRCERELR
jgi:hypothetical protein